MSSRIRVGAGKSWRIAAAIALIAGVGLFSGLRPALRPVLRKIARATRSETTASDEGAGNAHGAAPLATMPLYFERNEGQTDPHVRYLSHTSRYSLFLTDEAVVVSMVGGGTNRGPVSAALREASAHDAPWLVESPVRIRMIGANPHPQMTALEPLPGRVNYLIGNDPAAWHKDVATFGRIRVGNVYPGVDVVYYGTPQTLEYDIVVAPGADPSKIKFAIEGPATTTLDARGNLGIATAAGVIMMHQPRIYERAADGSETPIAGRFVLAPDGTIEAGVRRREVALALADYDHSRTLVIDPEVNEFVYSSYLGGHAQTTGPVNLEQFASFLQGQTLTVADVGLDVAVDQSLDAYVVGTAYSNDFPRMNAFQNSDEGAILDSQQNPNVFVSEFDTAQSGAASLVYSTYVGGSGDINPSDAGDGNGDQGYGIAVDGSGDAYFVGSTYSKQETGATGFPNSCGSWGQGNNKGAEDINNGFVAELNPQGNGLVYSCFIHGAKGAPAARVAIPPSCSANCEAYVSGSTTSFAADDFPVTSGALQTDNADTFGNSNAYLVVAGGGGSSEIYGTFYGGAGAAEGGDAGLGVVVDSEGNGYITGLTFSSLIPTQNPAVGTFQGTAGQTSNAFVAEFNPTAKGASSLVYGTYLGGSGASASVIIATFSLGDIGTGITLDGSGHIWVTGLTASTNFQVPGTVTPVFQSINEANANAGAPASAAFITELDPTKSLLSQVLYSTYFGGHGHAVGEFGLSAGLGDAATDIQVVGGNVYLTGLTTSTSGFPLSSNGCLQTNQSAGISIEGFAVPATAFVSELDPATNQLVFSTYLGGNGEGDAGAGVKVDANGNIVVAGITYSTDFPVTATAFQTGNNARSEESTNAFLTVLNPAGTSCSLSGATPAVTATATPTTIAATPTPTSTASAATATPTPTPSVPTPTAMITASPTKLSFSVDASGTATAKTVTLTDVGKDGPATIGTILPVGRFLITADQCSGKALSKKKSCKFGVEFAPLSTGPEAQTLTIPHNGAPVSVALSGTGLAVVVKASTPATFPAQAAGSTGKAKGIAFTNSGTVAIVAGTADLTGPFEITTDGCSKSALPAGHKCTISVAFAPAAGTSGKLAGTLTLPFAYGANDGQATVALSGPVKK
jgi:hypothetical protein